MHEHKFTKVLDHGHVGLIDHMGNDLSVVRAARVSYNAAWRTGDDQGSDEKLLNYLWKNRHTTPFESVTFTFDVKAPIFIFRQWHRHRTFAYNELSARYRELPREYYLPDPQIIGAQAAKNKQARDITEMGATELSERASEVELLRQATENVFDVYKTLLEKGWPRELARSILPVTTYSHMQCTVSLLNLLKFLTLRCDSHAQWEIQQYANAMVDLIEPIVPVTVAAWKESLNVKA